MPTNEERREVAARLRNWESFRETFRESPICAVIDALGVEGYLDWRGVFELLADLIEPEPERTCKMELVKGGPIYSVYRFSCCGYEHSENVTDGGATGLPGTRCPKCGTKVEE